MSIKIYNGMIAANRTSPFIFAARIREVIRTVTMNKLVTIYQQLLVRRNDQSNWGEHLAFCDIDPGGNEPINWDTLALELPRKIVELNDYPFRTGSQADILCSAAILPNRYQDRTLPLLMTFGEQDHHYRDALIAAGVADDYHYQNQTEQPDDVSEKAWEARRHAWADLIEEDLTPSEVGLMIEPPSAFAMSQHLMQWERDQV